MPEPMLGVAFAAEPTAPEESTNAEDEPPGHVHDATIRSAQKATPPPPPLPPPTDPVRIVIPSIGVDATVLAMGVRSDGKMDVPHNYRDVGWWSGGTVPGLEGAAVMGAHVDNGSWRAGVFKNLKMMQPGQVIEITDSESAARTFRVVDIKVYDYREKDTSSVFLAPGKKALRLITCHGRWLPSEHTYDSRLIVFAELVE